MCPSNQPQQQLRAVDVQQQQTAVKLPPELEGLRPNVGVCLFHPDKGVFAAIRLDDPYKHWQMPQGDYLDHDAAGVMPAPLAQASAQPAISPSC